MAATPLSSGLPQPGSTTTAHTPYGFDLLMVDRTISTPVSVFNNSFPAAPQQMRLPQQQQQQQEVPMYPPPNPSLMSACILPDGCSPLSQGGMTTTPMNGSLSSNPFYGQSTEDMSTLLLGAAPQPTPNQSQYMTLNTLGNGWQGAGSLHAPPCLPAREKAMVSRRPSQQYSYSNSAASQLTSAPLAAEVPAPTVTLHDRLAAAASRYIFSEIAHCDYTGTTGSISAHHAEQLQQYEASLFRSAPQEMLGFFATQLPETSIASYISVIVAQSNASGTCLLVALQLMKKLTLLHGAECPVTPRSVHRLFLACYLLAIKCEEESYHPLAYYASLGGIAPAELKTLERTLFILMDFNCFVNAEDYRQTLFAMRRTVTTTAAAAATPTPSSVGRFQDEFPTEVEWDALLPAMV